MDRVREDAEELAPKRENVRPEVRFEKLTDPTQDYGAGGVWTFKVRAPIFVCSACGQAAPGQPVNLDRRRLDAWGDEVEFTMDFEPPVEWRTDIGSPSKCLCRKCNEDFERTRSDIFGMVEEAWLKRRQEEMKKGK